MMSWWEFMDKFSIFPSYLQIQKRINSEHLINLRIFMVLHCPCHSLPSFLVVHPAGPFSICREHSATLAEVWLSCFLVTPQRSQPHCKGFIHLIGLSHNQKEEMLKWKLLAPSKKPMQIQVMWTRRFRIFQPRPLVGQELSRGKTSDFRQQSWGKVMRIQTKVWLWNFCISFFPPQFLGEPFWWNILCSPLNAFICHMSHPRAEWCTVKETITAAPNLQSSIHNAQCASSMYKLKDSRLMPNTGKHSGSCEHRLEMIFDSLNAVDEFILPQMVLSRAQYRKSHESWLFNNSQRVLHKASQILQ